VQAQCFGSDKFKEQDKDKTVEELISAEQQELSDEWEKADEDRPEDPEKVWDWLWAKRDRSQ
jgi:hypothetical protein